MSFITTNPNPYIINVPELQSVLTSATGTSNTNNEFINYIDTTTNSGSFNSIGSFNSGAITITNDLYLSNSGLYINDIPIIPSDNTVNGNLYMSMTVNNIEITRFNSNGLGIFTATPQAALHVNGSAIFASTVYISSFGIPAGPSIGNLIADGFLEANGFVYPSDPRLKKDIKPYVSNNLPQAVEFLWKSSGERDIGVLADDVAAIEPACVKSSVQGYLTVDYSKLVVLCLAEISELKKQVHELRTRLDT
jgi:hypothetical protein